MTPTNEQSPLLAGDNTNLIKRKFSTASTNELRAAITNSSTSGSYGLLAVNSESIVPDPETNVWNETKTLLRYSVPLIVGFFLQYSLTVASVFSVGRLGSSELAAVSLSSMTANISGYAIIQGVSTCLDTLCSQAHGRKDFNMVGVHFVRCTYFLLLICIPVVILWMLLAKPILLLLVGEEKRELVNLASSYLKILALGLPGFIAFENLKHFLQAQGIFHASTYVLFVCAPLNALLNYLLVWDKRIGIGFLGAPLAVVITDWTMLAMLLYYTLRIDGDQCLPKQKLTENIYFSNWGRMINLSIPGVLMVEAEWLAFEVITFTAARFGTEVLAAQSIVTTTGALLYQIPFAYSIAASTRLAWFIGAASKKASLYCIRAAMYSAVVLGVGNMLALICFRDFFARLYTSDEVVLKIASKVLIVAGVYQVNDFISCTSGGLLRGQGRQKIGGYLNLISYYIIALPSGFLFAFYYNMELLGLWTGMILALVFVSGSQTYFIFTSDWEKIFKEAEAVEDELPEENVPELEPVTLVPATRSNHLA